MHAADSPTERSGPTTPNQGNVMPLLVGFSSGVAVLSLGIAIWALNRPQQSEIKSKDVPLVQSTVATPGDLRPSVTSDNQATTTSDALESKRKATLAYWQAVREEDRKLMEGPLPRMFQVLNESKDQASALHQLVEVADAFAAASDQYTTAIMRLPVLDVDEALLAYTREDIRLGNQIGVALSGIAQHAVAIESWNQKKQSPPDTIVGDMVDSFVMGFLGQPFAGYQKYKDDMAKLDEEGRQLLQGYYGQCETFSKCLGAVNERVVLENELRASLSKRYSVEFQPLPQQ